MRRFELISAVTLASVLTLGAAQALAQDTVDVTCGQTITEDATLASDLLNCPNNGIVIGADDITLDLNGHTVAGNGKPVRKCPRNEFCDGGLLNDGHDGVTVRDGAVREFGTGVFVGKARHNRVLGIASSRNQFFGFVVAESARSVVRDSSGNGNPVPDGDGIGVFGSRHLRIRDNAFRRNALGMHVEDSSDILIKGNVFSRNRTDGIKLEGSRNQVRGNSCARNSACVSVDRGNRNVVAGNRSLRDVGGVLILRGRANLVTRNVVVRARINGIRLAFEEPGLGGTSNVVRGNVVRGSGGDGFAVAENDRHSVLKGNIAIAAGDDGFDIESASTRLTRNRAVRNADLGIEAVFGVTDGGGNRASGNGNPLQCTNVFCK
jgi:parallel beta-helix repeat protein